MGHDSADDMVTRYRIDGLGIELWCRWDFPQPPRLVLGSTQPRIQWV